MHVRRVIRCAALALTLALGGSVAAEEEPPKKDAKKAPPPKADFQDRVEAGIERGVTWLKRLQQKDGSWGPCVGASVGYDGTPIRDPTCYTTGPTSFALFTLARCRVPREDPVIQKGLKWMRKQLEKAPKKERSLSGHMYTSYESSSAILMLTAIYHSRHKPKPSRSPYAPPKKSAWKREDWRLMHACVKHLVGENRKRGCQLRDGSFAYQRDDDEGDVSASQFALLALRAAVRAGYPLKHTASNVWTKSLRYLERVQQDDGAFPYKQNEAWSAGMTAAGLASLLICREQLRLESKKPPLWVDGAITRGLDHLGKHYDPAINKAGDQRAGRYYHYCYLYAIERVGALAKRHKLGEKDWYRPGAELLLEAQQEGGHFEDPTSMRPTRTLGTCFALLFLKRATLPVVTGAAQPK